MVEILLHLFRMKDDKLHSLLAESNLFKILLEVIEKNLWNDILHNYITNIIKAALRAPNEDLKMGLFKHANILDFIMLMCSDPDVEHVSK